MDTLLVYIGHTAAASASLDLPLPLYPGHGISVVQLTSVLLRIQGEDIGLYGERRWHFASYIILETS